jgi:beta-ribofuranosylaminobenzene 5'-phosphate synthase
MSLSKDLCLKGIDALDSPAQEALNRVAVKMSDPIRGGLCATLVKYAPQHVGYGSKTSLLLSLIAGISALSGERPSYAEQLLLSGRGGASGIGCHTFLKGGVVWDGGHARSSVNTLLPSALRTSAIAPPPLLGRWPFPAEWSVFTALSQEERVAGEDELRIWRENTPVERSVALETISCIAHGVIPAIAISHLESLCDSLIQLHTMGFKKAELEARSPTVQNLLNELHRQKFAAGLSSLGPLIYIIIKGDAKDTDAALRKTVSKFSVRLDGPFKGINYGHRIKRGG